MNADSNTPNVPLVFSSSQSRAGVQHSRYSSDASEDFENSSENMISKLGRVINV